MNYIKIKGRKYREDKLNASKEVVSKEPPIKKKDVTKVKGSSKK